MKKSIWINMIFYLSWFCLLLGLTGFWPPAGTGSHAQVVPADGVLPPWLKWLVYIAMLLLMMMILFNYLSRPRAKNRLTKKIVLAFLFALVIGGAIFVYWMFGGIRKKILGFFLIGILFFLIVLLAANGKRLNNQSNSLMWKTVILFTASLTALLCAPQLWGFSGYEIELSGSLLEYYAAQLSLTFITISVMSVLSDKSVVVYWQNVAERKLIKPLFGSFAAYTAYSVAATVGAGVGVLTDNATAFAVFFAINVIVLILLTLTMVDVYYGREQKKRFLACELRRTAHGYIKNGYVENPFSGTDTFANKKLMHASRVDEYREMMYSLQYHLYQEIQSHNIPYLKEVAELYGGNMDCFDSPEGQEVVKMLFSAPIDLVPMMVDGVDQRISLMERDHRGLKGLKENFWYEDEALWSFFAKRSVWEILSKSPSFRKQMTKIVLDRLMLLWLDISLFKGTYVKLPVKWKYPYYRIGIGSCRIGKLFKEFLKAHGEESRLIAHLARAVLLLMEDPDDFSKDLILSNQVVWALTLHLEHLGLGEDEIHLWKKKLPVKGEKI